MTSTGPFKASAARRGGLAREAVGAYLYLLPTLFVLFLFVYWPLLQSLYLSLHDWNLLRRGGPFVGLENYLRVLSDPAFWQLLWQSGAYVGLALLGNFLLPVALALLTLQVSSREAETYQALLFAPTVVAASVGSLIWLWFYLPAGGLFNAVFQGLGLPPLGFLSDPALALPSVALVAAWKFLGFHYLIALAGLRAIPRDYLEAARVDGAVGLSLVRHILWPLFAPTGLYLFLSTLIQSLEYAFIPIDVMTLGGPSGTSSNLMYQVYLESFRFFRIGIASAQSILLVLLFAGFILWQLRLMERGVEYAR